MIFKTFDSSSNKLISFIKELRKSIDQIGVSIRQRETEIEALMGTMSEKEARAEAGSLWSYIFGQKGTEAKPYDLSSFLELDEAGAASLLARLQGIETKSLSNASAWLEYFSALKEGEEWQIKFVQNADLQKTSLKDLIEASQEARRSAIEHNTALERQTLGYKAASLGAKALTMAMNIAVFTLITKGIELLANSIYNYIHRLDTAREELSKVSTELESVNTELDSARNKIDALLSKGKLDLTDESTLRQLQEEVDLLEARQRLLKEQEYEKQQKTNRLISEQYNKYFTTAITTTADGTIVEKDALSFFKDIYDRAMNYATSDVPLSEEESLDFENMISGASDLGSQLVELLEDFKPLTAEEEQQKEAMEEMLHYASQIADLYAGISYMPVEQPTADFDDIFSLENAEGASSALGRISDSIDTIQNAYKTLSSAIEEYNETGAFSVDTLQSVIALGGSWLDYLTDEEGNLRLDQEALEALTLARLNDMRVQAVNNVIDNASKVRTDAEANLYLASTNYELANSIEAVAQAKIKEAEAEIRKNIGADLSETSADAVIRKMYTDVSKINTLFTSVDLGSVSVSGDSASRSASYAAREYEQLYDSFERRTAVLNDALDLLSSDLEHVTGAFAKNNLLDAQKSIYSELHRNYSDALLMYQEMADAALSALPSDLADKAKNGAVDLTNFIGDSGEAAADAIQEYAKWADKVSDCRQELSELKASLRQLELSKFNNVLQDYTDRFDIYDTSKSLIDKQIALFEEAGKLVGASFYTAQKAETQKQLALLEEEKERLTGQLQSALSGGFIEKGTEEWLEMVNALSDVEGSILDCKTAIEEFDNAVLELHSEMFSRIQEQFSAFDDELDNLIGLMDDLNPAGQDNTWTAAGLTKLGLLAQQYELAQYRVKQYDSEISRLNDAYLNGRYSAAEYTDKLAELSAGQWDAVHAAASAKDAILELNEARINTAVDGINKEIDAYRELIDAQIESLRASKDLHDYEASIAEKTKSVSDLERQIAAMQNDTTAAAAAKRRQLEAQLEEAKKTLEDAEYEHAIQLQEEALTQQAETYEKARGEEIEALQASLEDQETILSQSFEAVKGNADLIGQEITQLALSHGVTVSDALITSWQSGETAIASYGAALSASSSAFIENIMFVEAEAWNLQAQADSTAASLSYMFSTRADGLVNELAYSYYSEENLNAMTNALQNSLHNTLESGYNVSGITNAFTSIANAANSAASAVSSYINAMNGSADTGSSYELIDESNPQNPVRTYTSLEKAIAEAQKRNAGLADDAAGYYIREKGGKIINSIGNYAGGTRSTESELIISDEEGFELKLPRLDSGNYTLLNQGTQILTKEQTDNIFDWAKINPSAFLPTNIAGTMNPLNPALPAQKTAGSNTLHIDNLVSVNGNIDDTNIKRMEKVAETAVTRAFRQFSDGIRS